jgi:hypothetical protein
VRSPDQTAPPPRRRYRPERARNTITTGYILRRSTLQVGSSTRHYGRNSAKNVWQKICRQRDVCQGKKKHSAKYKSEKFKKRNRKKIYWGRHAQLLTHLTGCTFFSKFFHKLLMIGFKLTTCCTQTTTSTTAPLDKCVNITFLFSTYYN